MNCENCGAPMVLYRQQNYFHCEHCHSYHFPKVSNDGIQLLCEAPERTLCPTCHIPLHIATLDNSFRGYQCKNCQGLLLSRGSFRLTVETRRARVTSPPDPPILLNREELNRKIYCPICRKAMMTHPYMGPGTIVIDTCDGCNIIWLDHGELSRVINAPGKDRGVGMSQVFDHLGKEHKIIKHKKKKNKYEADLLKLLDNFF